MNTRRTISIIFIAVIISSCSVNDKKQLDKISVFTSIIPQKYFVERVGGDRVNVEVLVQPGKSPSTYEPLPEQVMNLGNADVFFTIGVPFEKAFLPKIKSSLKNLKIVDTSNGIKKRYLQNHVHEEDHGENHDEEDPLKTEDPHIWLSPILVIKQAEIIMEALIEVDPDGEGDYKKNFEDFRKDLLDLHTELKQELKPLKGSEFFIYHPSFGYFADEYGLKQIAVEIGGKEPSPVDINKVVEYAKKQSVKIIFVQPEFSVRSAKVIADAIDGAVITLNPLDPDYINNLRKISEALKEAK